MKTEQKESQESDQRERSKDLLYSKIEIERNGGADLGGHEYALEQEKISNSLDREQEIDAWDAVLTPLTRKEWQTIIEQAKESLEKLAGAEPEFVLLVDGAVRSLNVSLQRLFNGDENGCKGGFRIAENSLLLIQNRLDEGIMTSTAHEQIAQASLNRAVSRFLTAFEHMEEYLEKKDPTQLFFAWDSFGDGVMAIVCSQRMTETTAA